LVKYLNGSYGTLSGVHFQCNGFVHLTKTSTNRQWM